jgi:hypothetical protein
MIFLAFVALFALTASVYGQGQDPADPTNPLTMGKGPKDGELVPAWIFYWLLGIGSVVCGGLLAGLKVLWNKLNAEDTPGLTETERTQLRDLHELHSVKDEDGVPRWYMPRQLLGTIQSLQSMAQDMQERLEQIDQNRQDRQAMRAAFESEKTEMRRIYTEEIKALQDKLSSEQEGRRSETQDLWRQNNDTTREVMTVIKDMIVALENATKVIEQVGFTGDEE